MFSRLGLSAGTCRSLARLGYETPTPVQTEAIPLVLSGVDVLARAQTGTGKTAAFGLPMIDRLQQAAVSSRRRPRALVLVPTRELAVQVHEALAAYAAGGPVRAVAIFGGVPMGGQIRALSRGTDIIVATPGRLLDHLQRRSLDLSAIAMLTLDEADRMLDMGFQPALRQVVAALPARRQTLLFSATLSDAVVRLSAEFTQQPVRVDVSAQQTVAVTVSHQVQEVAANAKRDALVGLLTEHRGGRALVFCRTKHGANRVGEDLSRRGLPAGVLHGNKSQGARSRVLDDFKAGRVRVLVATDIAARGIDIAALPLVINFDLPRVAEDYVHRVGRTGRAGQPGRAVSLISAADAPLLRQIQRVTGQALERLAPRTGDVPSAGRVTPAEPVRARQPHTPASGRAMPQAPRGRNGRPPRHPRGRRTFTKGRSPAA